MSDEKQFTDADRIQWLATCEDGVPFCDALGSPFNDFYSHLADVLCDKYPQDVVSQADFEGTSEDKAEAFRRMIDVAMREEQKP